jgi:hypothetical protein
VPLENVFDTERSDTRGRGRTASGSGAARVASATLFNSGSVFRQEAGVGGQAADRFQATAE